MGFWLRKGMGVPTGGEANYDFGQQPDLAQTMAVLLAARGRRAVFSGLESLRVKETDRVAALQAELGKFEVQLRAQDVGGGV